MTEDLDRTPKRARPPATIRNAVIHMSNEQPLLADLFEVPSPSDQGLVCTNLRSLDGKRPLFADDVRSTFFFPYQHIRFVEIKPTDGGPPLLEAPTGTGAGAAPEEPEADLEIDEDFLKRIRDA
jgi:hypothetical protein